MTGKVEKTGRNLTPKQEAFAVAFFTHGNAAQAYRDAYDVSENAKDHWIYVEAGQLLDHPEIALRLEALKDQAARHAIYTRQTAMEEYEAARKLAENLGNPSAAVSAVNGKVKLWGLEAPTKQTIDHKSTDGSMTPKQTIDLSKMTDEELDAYRTVAAAAERHRKGD